MTESFAASLRGLRDPIAIVAFGGWNDAGNAASQAADQLAESYAAQLAYAIDPDDYYDFQVNRPEVSIDDAERRSVTWPTTEISVGLLPGDRHLVLIRGLEPNLRWRQFTATLCSALLSARATRVYLMGSLLADTPHTRPIPISVNTQLPELAEQLGLEPSTYEGPTGIVGVLADSINRAGMEAVSLWAAIPHYVSHPPCPKGTLALLSRLEDLLDIPLELGDLPELARAWERGVDELAAEDTEVSEYVAALEHQRDETELPEASGDAIAAEFERYLRRRSED